MLEHCALTSRPRQHGRRRLSKVFDWYFNWNKKQKNKKSYLNFYCRPFFSLSIKPDFFYISSNFQTVRSYTLSSSNSGFVQREVTLAVWNDKSDSIHSLGGIIKSDQNYFQMENYAIKILKSSLILEKNDLEIYEIGLDLC